MLFFELYFFPWCFFTGRSLWQKNTNLMLWFWFISGKIHKKNPEILCHLWGTHKQVQCWLEKREIMHVFYFSLALGAEWNRLKFFTLFVFENKEIGNKTIVDDLTLWFVRLLLRRKNQNMRKLGDEIALNENIFKGFKIVQKVCDVMR